MSVLRSFAEAVIRRLPERLQPMVRWRFIKFGVVGASGTVVNLAVLYLAQEFLFSRIADFHDRLNYSIALAITVATISNFYWNRRLTWRDRKHEVHHLQFCGQRPHDFPPPPRQNCGNRRKFPARFP
jgi:hypothetical protein